MIGKPNNIFVYIHPQRHLFIRVTSLLMTYSSAFTQLQWDWRSLNLGASTRLLAKPIRSYPIALCMPNRVSQLRIWAGHLPNIASHTSDWARATRKILHLGFRVITPRCMSMKLEGYCNWPPGTSGFLRSRLVDQGIALMKMNFNMFT
jgi:hypothetical protein